MPRKKIVVALSGQPNCGKSTMFNAITGSTARVGNYPGITVERMEGFRKTKDYKIIVLFHKFLERATQIPIASAINTSPSLSLPSLKE